MCRCRTGARRATLAEHGSTTGTDRSADQAYRRATYDGAMTRAKRVAAIALCAVVAFGIGGQLDGKLNLPLAIGLHQRDKGSGTGSASAVPKVDEKAARVAAANDLLSARAAAVKARNKSSWMDTVDLASSAFRARQSVVFDNLIKLPLGQFSYGVVQAAPALSATRIAAAGPDAWAATVTGTYSLTGFDRAPQSFDATYTLVHRPAGWRLSADTDGDTPLQMWDLPGLRVLAGPSSIVVGNAPEARMQEYSAVAAAAVSRVRGVWGTDWNSHVVIVTPATRDQFAQLVSRSAGSGLDQVAAITQGVIEPGQRATGDEVVVNPDAYTALAPLGRRVVITHELTHVAARSSTVDPVPTWLTEGMADYVGYSGLDIPRQRVASELLVLVRAGKGPTGLPTDLNFDPSRSKIATSYSEAWLAICHLVDLYGQAKVVSFYRAVAAYQRTDGAPQADPETVAASQFPRSFGVSQPQYVESWQRYLQTLAHA